MKLVRNLTLREVEDEEIRIVLKGFDMNAKSVADERMRTEALRQKEEKLHRSRVLAQLTKNQKEIEQLRELHLLQQKYIARYIDCELEILYENEALLSEQVAKEQTLEDHLADQEHQEENRINIKLAALQSTQTQRAVSMEAAAVRERQRKEAKLLIHKEAIEAKRREKEFWHKEIEKFIAQMEELKLPTSGPEFDAKLEHIMPRMPKDLLDEIDETNFAFEDEESQVENFADDDVNVQAVRAREEALFETLKKSHRQA
ncbi:hypothetical protein BC830DRAFT_1175854, partial [Chytriomyces sp. MP71]